MSKRLPVYDINDYILNGTTVGALLGWTNAPGELRPIIPIQQQPEMNEENPANPYMVYTYRQAPEPEQWWTMTEEITYTIWGKGLDAITEVTNELTDIFKRLDDSAQEVNTWLRQRATPAREFEFYYFRVVSSFSPEATQAEAGRYGKPLSLRYQYAPLAGRGIA